MKNIIIVVFLFSVMNIFSQEYKLHIEKRIDPDKDNIIFKINREFIYDYYILYKNVDYKIKLKWKDFGTENRVLEDWELSSGMEDSLVIKNIKYIVAKRNFFNRTNKFQTEVNIIFSTDLANIPSWTGIVENSKNLWIHPPRGYFFNILELCPFPFIKYPITINHEWNDKFSVGDWWGDKGWAEWTGRLLLNIHYKIVEQENVLFKEQELLCHVVESYAKSSLGTTSLKSYYHEDFGFVKLIYKAFDYEIVLYLSDVFKS